MKTFWGLTAVLLTVAMAGCTPKSMSGDVYSRERAQRIQTIEYGEVIDVRQVLIEGTKSGVGTLAGGVLGGALGSGIGRGAGSTIGVVGGAIDEAADPRQLVGVVDGSEQHVVVVGEAGPRGLGGIGEGGGFGGGTAEGCDEGG